MSTSLVTVPTDALALLEPLVERARAYVDESKAANTRRAYEADFRTFQAWCTRHGVGALPAEPETVAVYVAVMADNGRKVSTIERALWGIVAKHYDSGHPSPKTDVVAKTMKGIRRKLGTAVSKKAPIRDVELTTMVSVLGVDLPGLRDRALLTLGWSGAFRRAELIALAVEGTEWLPKGVNVSIARSKTDQEGEGKKVAIPYARNPAVCPVRALKAWLSAAKIESGPIFRRFSRGGHLRATTLSDEGLVLVIKRTAERAGLDPKRLAGHSLRRGFATTAAEKGKSMRAIKKGGRWTSDRIAAGYIDDADLWIDNPAEGLL